jgi:hypothetical protein
MVAWLLRSAQSIIFSVNSIRLNHAEPDRKQTELITRVDSENRSTSPPMGLRGHLSA